MKITRILVVDDAIAIRGILSKVLAETPGFQVVATAENGQIAIEKFEVHKPDIVILDVIMPVLDGLSTLKELRKRDRRTRILMYSALTKKGATETVDALLFGADDYLPTAAQMDNRAAVEDQIRKTVVPKIKELVAEESRAAAFQATPTSSKPPAVAGPSRPASRRLDLVVIGASTGGPEAFSDLMPRFPADFPVPVMVVQHMPANFTRILAERLSTQSQLDVIEPVGGESLRPGMVLIAPGDHHMGITKEAIELKVQLHRSPRVNNCRPSVDVMLESVVKAVGGRAVCAILTGMGKDGLNGCTALAEAGGQVIAQDRGTSTIWGMPRAVAEAGVAHSVVPLDGIYSEIATRVAQNRAWKP